MPVETKQFISADEFWEMLSQPEYRGRRLELVDGEIVDYTEYDEDGNRAPAGAEHGYAALGIGAQILLHVRQHDLGLTFGAETGFILGKDEQGKTVVRAGDVVFVAKGRMKLPYKKYIPVVPDFVAEVISPNDTLEEINGKIEDYLQYSVRMFVFVNLKRRTMHVYAGDKITILSETDTFDGGDVLPGFTLTVGDIFPKDEE